MRTSFPHGGELLLQLIAVPGALEILEAHGVALALVAAEHTPPRETPDLLEKLAQALTVLRGTSDATGSPTGGEPWSDVLAHEVRNALTGVLGAVQLAARRQASDYERGVALELAQTESLRCIDLLERELRPPPVASAQLTAPTPGVCVDEVAEEATLLVALAAAAKSVSLTTAHEIRPLAARVPEDELKQVLLNLLLNALHAVGEGGEVTVTTREEAGMVVVAVSDDGHGVLPAHLDQIFEPGFTLRQDGSGLGLAISRAIVRRHGGDLTVASTATVGTRFSIALPKVAEAG